MTTTQAMSFDLDLRNILPRLRVYALSLTRDSDRADDLVQQTAMKALAGRESFLPGTNFASWMFRIERNEFISELRRARPTVNIEDVAEASLATPAMQENRLAAREFVVAFRKLSANARQALVLSHLVGFSHEKIAEHAGVAVGTVKSRVFRGREALQKLLGA